LIYRQADSPEERCLLWALGASLVVYLVFCLFSVAARTSLCAVFFIMITGWVFAWRQRLGHDPVGLHAKWLGLIIVPVLVFSLIVGACIVTADALVYAVQTGKAQPRQLERAARLWPGNVNSWRFLLNHIGEQDPVDMDKAGIIYRRSQELIPGYFEVPLVYARLLTNSKRPREALIALEEAIEGRPYSLDEQFLAVSTAWQLGDTNEMEFQLRRMLGNMVAYSNGVAGTNHQLMEENGTGTRVTILTLDDGEVIRLRPGELIRVFFEENRRQPQVSGFNFRNR
jgi:hypothetical protein